MEQTFMEQKKNKPYILIALIIVNAAVYLVTEILGNTESAAYMVNCGAVYPPYIMGDGEYWRLLAATFLHFGAIHLANNMLMLAAAGNILEDAIGHLRFLLLYLLSGIFSSILSLAIMLLRGENYVSAGASGAVFGVVGALLWVVIANRGHYKTLSSRGMLGLVALSLYFGYTNAGTDNWGHLGGLAAGFLLGILMYRREKSNEFYD